MTSHEVTELLDHLERRGVAVWLDGGWAVDALLGEQTRPHADVDIVIEERSVATLRQFLDAEGFRDVPRDDTSAWNFVGALCRRFGIEYPEEYRRARGDPRLD